MALDLVAMQRLARPVDAMYEGRALRQKERLLSQEEELNQLEIDAIKNPAPEIDIDGFHRDMKTEAQQLVQYENNLIESGIDDADRNILVQTRFRESQQRIAKAYPIMGVSFSEEAQWDPQKAKAWLDQVADEGGETINLMPPGSRSMDDLRTLRRDDAEVDSLIDQGWKRVGVAQPTGTPAELGMIDPSVGRALQEELISVNTSIDRLQTLGASFDPRFLTVPGRIQNVATRVRELDIPVLRTLIGEPTEEEKQFLQQFTSFRSTALRELNALINRLSGAATSAQEAERLRSTMPDPDNNTISEFIANYDSTMRDLQLIKARNSIAMKDGIDISSGDDLAEFMTLDSVKDRVNRHYADLFEQYKQQGMSEEEARREAQLSTAREFGI